MWENLHTLHTNTKLFLKLLVVARATLEYCAWKKVLYLYLACEIIFDKLEKDCFEIW